MRWRNIDYLGRCASRERGKPNRERLLTKHID
jgi:hypothetical protein